MPMRSEPRAIPAGRGLLAATGAVAALLLAACGGDPAGHVEEENPPDLAHIHGLGVNPADGELYVASHHGIFLVTGNGDARQIAGRTQDFMGFTVVGPDHFLGSGHPGPDDGDQPPHLGLIESTDAAKTWQPVSLSGEVDFHALEAEHDRVYGWDSQSRQLMVSDDRQNWDRRAQLPLWDLAVSPEDADVVLATTQEGFARSTDGGKTFARVDDAPTLVFIDWADAKRLVGVGPDGAVHVSEDGGDTWTEQGTVSGGPQAILVHGESELYVATEEAIFHSTDDGESFTEFHALS